MLAGFISEPTPLCCPARKLCFKPTSVQATALHCMHHEHVGCWTSLGMCCLVLLCQARSVAACGRMNF